MKKRALTIGLAIILSTLFLADVYAGSAAKIKLIDGKVSVLKIIEYAFEKMAFYYTIKIITEIL